MLTNSKNKAIFFFRQVKKYMNIQKFNNTPQKANFTAIPIRDVNLLDKKGNKTLKATIVELERSCDKDMFTLERTLEKEPDNAFKGLLASILETLKNKNHEETKVFALTVPEGKDIKILGCMNLTTIESNAKKRLYLNNLYVTDNFATRNDSRQVKGVGESLLAQAINLAKNIKANALAFQSIDDNFYIHSFNSANLENTKSPNFSVFHVHDTEYNKYLDYCGSKYESNFSKDINE